MSSNFISEREALIEQSKLNMAGLLNKAEDKSLETEAVNLHSCEDIALKNNAYKWCKRCLGGTWAKISLDQFKIQYVSGGLTNYLYMCSLPDGIKCQPKEPNKVLVRIYGEILDNRAKFYEGVIFTLLSERGFGPHLYGVFSSGRVEQYVPARHLKTKELADPDLSRSIAKKLAKYHSMELPLNKEPTWVWESMEKWISASEAIHFDDPKKQEILQRIKDMRLTEDYFKLKSFLIETNSKVVFCHNDSQEGNILLLKKNGLTDVLLIDYEYSSYNYRGFEFGNHFCEWMYDYSNDQFPKYFRREEDYPNNTQQIHFMTEYLKEYKCLTSKGECDVSDEEVEQALLEANRFALASHLFWGFWSIVQENISKIEFGFLEYAVSRFETYCKQREIFWPEYR